MGQIDAWLQSTFEVNFSFHYVANISFAYEANSLLDQLAYMNRILMDK